jgi:6-phosphogluconate dehydrogenase
MTHKEPQQQYEIGKVGLGVMGRNLVLNMADRERVVGLHSLEA